MRDVTHVANLPPTRRNTNTYNMSIQFNKMIYSVHLTKNDVLVVFVIDVVIRTAVSCYVIITVQQTTLCQLAQTLL